MKKLISIGVALALLTMAVVPGAVAAYDPPATYSKVPFAIIASGLELVGDIVLALPEDMGIPLWIADVTDAIAPWAAGPLSWTVDMLAWAIDLAGVVIGGVPMIADALPEGLDLEGLFSDIACGLLTCWSTSNCTGEFDPCGLLP